MIRVREFHQLDRRALFNAELHAALLDKLFPRRATVITSADLLESLKG